MDEVPWHFPLESTFGFHEQFQTRASLPVVPDMHCMRATYATQSFDNNTFERISKRFSAERSLEIPWKIEFWIAFYKERLNYKSIFPFFPRGRDVKFTFKLHRRMHTRKARLFNCRESLLKILAENVTPIYIYIIIKSWLYIASWTGCKSWKIFKSRACRRVMAAYSSRPNHALFFLNISIFVFLSPFFSCSTDEQEVN